MIDNLYWLKKGLFVLGCVVVALGVVFVIATCPELVGAAVLAVFDQLRAWLPGG